MKLHGIKSFNNSSVLIGVLCLCAHATCLAQSQSDTSYSSQYWPARWSTAIHQNSNKFPKRDNSTKEFEDETNAVSGDDLFSTLENHYSPYTHERMNRGYQYSLNPRISYNHNPYDRHNYNYRGAPHSVNPEHNNIQFINPNSYMPFGGLPYPVYRAEDRYLMGGYSDPYYGYYGYPLPNYHVPNYPGFDYSRMGYPQTGYPLGLNTNNMGLPFFGMFNPFSIW